jgi:hypothetical protein
MLYGSTVLAPGSSVPLAPEVLAITAPGSVAMHHAALQCTSVGFDKLLF